LLRTWEAGGKVRKLIGFDSTEDHRTFADGKGLKVAPRKGLPSYGDRYVMEYPLRTWGMDRAACGRAIVNAGLPLPPKSACFFCPAMKQIEIELLRRDEPLLYALAIEMERLYRAGPHFRGSDNEWNVKAEHKVTKEIVEWTIVAANVQAVRVAARTTLKDSKPYRWKIGVSQAVAGLGRNFSWQSLEQIA
jgi:hypothetical protein